MTRTTARIVAIMAFIAGLLLAGSLVFPGGLNGGFAVLAFALTLSVFSVLSSAARGLPGSGFLRAGFICGVASLVLTFLLPFLGLIGLTSEIAVLLWPIALALVAVGLLRSHLVPPLAAWLAGAWSVVVALRDIVALWIPLRLPGAATAIVVVPAVIGILFSLALGVSVLARSKEPQ